jgi:hypothetical protein
MPTSAFNPEKLIKRFQTGEWDEHPLYRPLYEYILKKQNDVIRKAEGLRLWRDQMTRITPYRCNPALKKRADIFYQEHINKLTDKKTCASYLRTLYRADHALRNSNIKWKLSLPVLIILAVIHLREILRYQHLDTTLMRKCIIDWQQANGENKKCASDNSQWSRTLKQPEIVQLLVPLRASNPAPYNTI